MAASTRARLAANSSRGKTSVKYVDGVPWTVTRPSRATRATDERRNTMGDCSPLDRPQGKKAGVGDDSETRRVLVVKDEGPIRELVRLHLELGGFAVDEAADGTRAL